jgi:hypothetical protein
MGQQQQAQINNNTIPKQNSHYITYKWKKKTTVATRIPLDPPGRIQTQFGDPSQNRISQPTSANS